MVSCRQLKPKKINLINFIKYLYLHIIRLKFKGTDYTYEKKNTDKKNTYYIDYYNNIITFTDNTGSSTFIHPIDNTNFKDEGNDIYASYNEMPYICRNDDGLYYYILLDNNTLIDKNILSADNLFLEDHLTDTTKKQAYKKVLVTQLKIYKPLFTKSPVSKKFSTFLINELNKPSMPLNETSIPLNETSIPLRKTKLDLGTNDFEKGDKIGFISKWPYISKEQYIGTSDTDYGVGLCESYAEGKIIRRVTEVERIENRKDGKKIISNIPEYEDTIYDILISGFRDIPVSGIRFQLENEPKPVTTN